MEAYNVFNLVGEKWPHLLSLGQMTLSPPPLEFFLSTFKYDSFVRESANQQRKDKTHQVREHFE